MQNSGGGSVTFSGAGTAVCAALMAVGAAVFAIRAGDSLLAVRKLRIINNNKKNTRLI